jgi:hypothetical protein
MKGFLEEFMFPNCHEMFPSLEAYKGLFGTTAHYEPWSPCGGILQFFLNLWQ